MASEIQDGLEPFKDASNCECEPQEDASAAPSLENPSEGSPVPATAVNCAEEEEAETPRKNVDGADTEEGVPLPDLSWANGEAPEDFFNRFSSIRETYEEIGRQTIREFKLPSDDEVSEKSLEDQLWPTIGGWTVDDLYSEVIYALLHSLKGKEHDESDAVISYLQQVFHIGNDKHCQVLEAAKEKLAPSLVLNLEVVEARDLKGKDMNGLSDPFCTIYVSSRLKHNTSMKPGTLNPSWREYFSFPVTSVQDEVLSLEVWDFDPVETVAEKMRKLSEVKSPRGLRILCKEIALTASTGKHKHEFLGSLKIPIKNIPADGFDTWFNLDGKNGKPNKKNGEIHLRMGMGAEKDKKVAAQEYRHVLHLLLVHELDEENSPKPWDGIFSKHSDYVLRQLRWQGGLQPSDVDLAKWLVYTRVQCEHALNANVFAPLFMALMDHVAKDAYTDDELRKIWFAAEKLVENFASALKGLHKAFLSNPDAVRQSVHMIETLAQIKKYLENHTLSKDYRGELSPDLILQKTENCLTRGAEELFNSIVKSDGPEGEETESMIKLGQLLIADLRMGLDKVNRQFNEQLGLDYFDITYRLYDELYCDLVEPIVTIISEYIKPLEDDDGDKPSSKEQDVSIGTSLFSLYLALKQFSDLSSELKNKDTSNLKIQGHFHCWFHSSVHHWLDIARYKAYQQIRRAVDVDSLRPVDRFVKHSSSAVDAPNIFQQIQIFWAQLAWPDVEESYTFIARILDDMCRCITAYADSMHARVEQLDQNRWQNKTYRISNELCLAINNIELVVARMRLISDKLEIDKTLKEVEAVNGKVAADQCRRTINTVMDNAIENVENKIYVILEEVGNKLHPVLLRFLYDGAETLQTKSDEVANLMKYLDNTLVVLKDHMTASAFDKAFRIIWERVSKSLRELIQTNVEKRRPPSFFSHVHEMLEILLDFFYPDGVDSAIIEETDIRVVKEIIELHGARTVDLMIRYYHDRHDHQTALRAKDAKSSIAVRVSYVEDTQKLKVEVLNCRNLIAKDKNGSSDPYVKVQISPFELHGVPSQKTKIKKKTLFPLFDETLMFCDLPRDIMSSGGFLLFTVKDHDTFGKNEMLGEAYLPLDAVPFTGSPSKIQDLPQMHLALTNPLENMQSALLIETMEKRTWDRAAVDFAKKERSKASGVVSP